MGKIYGTKQIAEMLCVTEQTVKTWEQARYIPQAFRVGLKRKRVWSEAKLRLILEFAKDNGYPVRNIEGALSE